MVETVSGTALGDKQHWKIILVCFTYLLACLIAYILNYLLTKLLTYLLTY